MFSKLTLPCEYFPRLLQETNYYLIKGIKLISSNVVHKSNCNFVKHYTKSAISNENIKKKVYPRLKKNGYLYIKDKENADSIASHLCNGWNGSILEANPGPGFLTEAILNKDVAKLRVYEKNEEFLPQISVLSKIHPNLEIIHEDIVLLPSLESKVFENDYDTFFGDIPQNSWEGKIPFRIFSTIYSQRSIKFLRYLLVVMPSKSSIFSFGRCEFFFLLPEWEYLYMVAEPKENLKKYRWVTVLYKIFFEIKCLHKYSSDIFHPSPPSSKKKKSKDQSFYLVQLTPNINLFSHVVYENKLPDFYFFVRHHLMKRTGLVIPTLEGWIPSCGPRLIKEGMGVFTKFGDLSPKQILLLFNQFSSWPEYSDSTFCTALQRFYSKGSVAFDIDETVDS